MMAKKLISQRQYLGWHRLTINKYLPQIFASENEKKYENKLEINNWVHKFVWRSKKLGYQVAKQISIS